MYAYVAFLVVFLTYGMETALFRFSTNENKKKNQFTVIPCSLTTTSSIFILIVSVFSQDIANLLKYPEHAEYIIWFGIIVGVDAISAMALAQLRLKRKSQKICTY